MCGEDEKLLIGIFYRSPNSSLESDEELYSLINVIDSKFNCEISWLEILISPTLTGF